MSLFIPLLNPHHSLTRIASFGFVVVVLTPHRSLGQSDNADLAHQKYCEQTRAALNARASNAEHRHSLRNIQSCGSLVVPALIAEWQKPQDDTVALYMLGRISGHFRDRTLFNTVASVAEDPNRPRVQRLSAFIALVEYYNPNRTIIVRERLAEPGLHPSAYVSLTAVFDVDTREGRNPLGKSIQRDVLELFQRIGTADPDATIKSIANFLVAQLQPIKS
jgi:hypothetical protein